MEKVPLTQINGIEIFRRKIEVLPKNKELLARSRSLRKGYVLSEVIFWKQVRNKEFHHQPGRRRRRLRRYMRIQQPSVGRRCDLSGRRQVDHRAGQQGAFELREQPLERRRQRLSGP